MLSTGTNRTAASVLKRVGVGGVGGGESSSERTLTEEAGMIAVKRLIFLLNFTLKNKVVMEVKTDFERFLIRTKNLKGAYRMYSINHEKLINAAAFNRVNTVI